MSKLLIPKSDIPKNDLPFRNKITTALSSVKISLRCTVFIKIIKLDQFLCSKFSTPHLTADSSVLNDRIKPKTLVKLSLIVRPQDFI